MLTLNPVLQVGAYDFAAHPLSRVVFESRINILREAMAAQDWSGVIVFGDRPEQGSLAYLTNFAPRLAGALALIPRDGPVRVLTFDGGRMVPAGALTTWVEDVEPAAPIADKLGDWINGLGGNGKLAVAEFAMMPSGLYSQLAEIDGVATAADATSALAAQRRTKSVAELDVFGGASDLLSTAEAAFIDAAASGVDVHDCAAQADNAAIKAGAQDVRILVSPDGGKTYAPYENPYTGPPRPAVAYMAVRFRGYWVDGFMDAGTSPTRKFLDEALDGLVASVSSGTAVADLIAARDELLNGHDPHPVLGNGMGAGLGTSPEEAPPLESGVTLAVGDVISLCVGVDDPTGALVRSRVVSVTESGCDVVWRSAN